ncbi:MAG: polysaccharide pyruvyl transferase family protein [Roseococcus sp.]|nr:polysaccharide pyruvyl transferase family protein [Roseococcus sp.]
MDAAIVTRFEAWNPALAAMFRDLRNQEVWYMPNPGNGGDCLIAAGTYQLFDHYGIKLNLFDGNSIGTVTNKTVFLAGGGNLIPLYSGMAQALRRLNGRGNRITVLPHTIRGNEELLASLGPDVTLFCREMDTFQYLSSASLTARIEQGHDLGLFVDIEQIRATPAVAEVAQPEFLERLLDKAKLTPADIEGRPMQCIRGGVESTFKPKGRNYDISIIFQAGVGPGRAEVGTWMMMEFTRLAAQITTNRLHIGIASILTGTPTRLYDNNYGKVSGIYHFSIKGNFPKVEMLDDPD